MNNDFIINYYPINNLSKTDLDLDLDLYNFDNIKICMFQIINTNNNPFLLFNLFNENNKLIWPNICNYINLENYNDKLNLSFIIKNIISSTKSKDVFIEYNGYYKYNNDLILCFDYNICYSIQHIDFNKQYYWASISEILNNKYCFHYTIDNTIIDFFHNNTDFIYLKDHNNSYYYIPTIGYYSNDYKNINYIITNGLLKEHYNSSFGPYYYFTNYNYCNKYIKFSNNNNINNINNIRVALFLNNTKYLTNYIFDKTKWTEFDSIIYNNNNNIKYIIKDLKNIIPLTTQFIYN